jgi:hypothetical protein
MTDEAIRDLIDSLAEPLSFDEVTDASVVTRVVPLNPSRRVQPWTIAAALIAVLGLAALVLVASRGSSARPAVGAQTVGLEVTPDDPEVGTSFVATFTGEGLDALTVRREAYIEKFVGAAWQRLWLVYPGFNDPGTALPQDPIELTGGSVPPGGSPIRLVATRPFRVTLPRQLEAGSYRFCMQAAGTASSVPDDNSCAPIVVRDTASTVTSVEPIQSVPSNVGSTSIGVEEPLVETETVGVDSVAKPTSAHAFDVEGHPPVSLWTTVMPNLQTGQVEEWQCVSEANGSGCGPVSLPAVFGQTSSIDNRVASDDLFTWSNLPADVDTVRYNDGVKQLWQHPVAGLAIFRVDPNYAHPDITAYDAAGALLPYAFWGQNPPLTPATDTTETVPTSPAILAAINQNFPELEALTQSSISDCLTTNGASFPVANVPSFDADADPVAVWNACVVEVHSKVAARVAALTKGQ